jgi:sugar/nucleoside kinase (ribokinase family)
MLKSIRVLLLAFVLGGISLYAETPRKTPEVLSLSAAIVDHFFLISEEQLRTITIEKGTWAPIDHATLTEILERNPNISRMVTGGSGVNVIKGLAHFKHRCAVVGKIGSDDKGEFFLRNMRRAGVDSYLEQGKLPTGQAICFITPDAERTFRSYLGASHSLTDMQLKDEYFEGVKLFHVEGYQVVDPDLVLRSLKKAKEKGVMISLDLANVEIVRRNKEFLFQILPDYIDILFCNELEAKELTGLPPKEACSNLASLCQIAVVTMSERGCWTQSGKSLFYSPAFAVNALDSTGAGDLFASGFLHGYLTNEPLQKCAWLGCLTASYVVKMLGAEIPDQIWDEIHQRIEDEDPFKTSLMLDKGAQELEEGPEYLKAG